MNEKRATYPPEGGLAGFLKFLKTPKGYVTAVLAGLTLVGALRPQDHAGLLNAAVAVITALILDGAMMKLQKRALRLSDGGVITALIVTDTLGHATPLPVIMATTAVALLSKHVLRDGRKPIFNPAAFGLLFAILAFTHTGQSWWGSLALLPAWFVSILIAGGLLVTLRANKFPQVAAFLGTYFLLLLAMAILHIGLPSDTPGDALRPPFVNTALYLAFFMLTDPPTSPAPYRRQVLFGAIAAAVSTAIFATEGGLAYLPAGLLTANLWKAVWQLAIKTRTGERGIMRT